MLACLVALPANAPAAKASSAPIPQCAHFSTTLLRGYLQSGPITMEQSIGNSCEWVGLISGHYRPLIQMRLVAVPKRVFTLAEHDARIEAASKGAMFASSGTIPMAPFSRRSGIASFTTTERVEPEGLPPCNPGQELPVFGPPLCSGEPPQTNESVQAWGRIKGKGPSLMVSIGEGAESGDVQLLDLLFVVRDVFAGHIH